MSDQSPTPSEAPRPDVNRPGFALRVGLAMAMIAFTCVAGFMLKLTLLFEELTAAGGGLAAIAVFRDQVWRYAILAGGTGVVGAVLAALALVGPMLRANRSILERLTRRTEEALAAARVQSQFLANMSHEIRTPMNGVLGLVGLLLRTPLDKKQRHYAESIEKAGTALLTILNDVLDFSKLEAGKHELRPVDCDLPRMTHEVVDLLAPKAEGKKLRLAYRVDKDVPPVVFADVDRLRQIVTNLLDNAIKFSEQGEVTVRLHRVMPEANRMWLQWDVSDTGIGISEADLQHVFEAFSQADSSTTRKRGGTGLGLAISRSLARAMGGVLEVHSDLGIGSSFRLRVPVSPESRRDADRSRRVSYASAPEEHDSHLAVDDGSWARHVLVVEDNEINQLVAVELLQSFGITTDLAQNGREAVTLVAARRYAAVLMDCQMPEMDGYQAARAIRALAGDAKNTPIIALTAHAMEGERQKVLDAGMDDYLAKPVQFSLLEQTLRHWIALPPKTVPPPSAVSDERAAGWTAQAQQLLEPTASRSLKVLELSLKLLPETVTALLAAAHDGDMQRTHEVAHRLKGSSMSIGALALAEQAERLLREEGQADVRLAADRLRVLCERTCAVLQHERDVLTGEST